MSLSALLHARQGRAKRGKQAESPHAAFALKKLPLTSTRANAIPIINELASFLLISDPPNFGYSFFLNQQPIETRYEPRRPNLKAVASFVNV
jgi:hypothetical protein